MKKRKPQVIDTFWVTGDDGNRYQLNEYKILMSEKLSFIGKMNRQPEFGCKDRRVEAVLTSFDENQFQLLKFWKGNASYITAFRDANSSSAG